VKAGSGRGMLTADSIDDLDLLRHGGMPRLFDGVQADAGRVSAFVHRRASAAAGQDRRGGDRAAHQPASLAVSGSTRPFPRSRSENGYRSGSRAKSS
jgi:hypothetical protein